MLENQENQNGQGRPVTLKEIWAIRLEWEKKVAHARRALKELDGDELVSGLNDYLLMLSSKKRPGEMVSLLNRASPETFWKVFLERWTICDRTWEYTSRWLRQLQKASKKVSAYAYYDDASRTFFDSLPDDVVIYRGCSRERVGGISWTADKSIAEGFARGHRSIAVPNPVIVTARISKKDIFCVFVDRQESEVVCSPREILEIERYVDLG